MKCSNCGFDNQDDALYCEACGSPLIKPVTYDNDPLHKGINNSEYNSGQSPNQGANSNDSGYGNSYSGQSNNGYNNGYNERYNNGYDDRYSGQYNNGYDDRYGGQYNNGYDDRYGGQYNNGYMDDSQWEEERQRRIEQRKARREYEQKKENSKIILIGIIIAAAIAVVGVAAFFGVKYFMGDSQTSQNQQQDVIENPIKNKDNNTTPTPSVTKEPELTPSATPTPTPTQTAKPTPTVTPTPEPELTAQVKTASSVDRSGYSKVKISDSSASSTIKQDNIDNSSKMTYDGDETTSWQEGAQGYGIGEFLHYELDKEYNVRYITFNMGNWRTEELFYQNCRPKDITVWVGDYSFDITVPDGMTEYCMELSKDVPATEVYIQINSVYTERTDCEDTCISEVGIYGK
jgi:flagellar basal body-associated protein FliL